MSDHPNVQKLKDGYAAFKNQDFETLNELFADDIIWHVPGTSPLAGDYKGKEEVFGFFGKTIEMSGGTFSLETHDFFANDERGVVLATVTAQRGGKTLNSRQANVMRFDDQGRVAEFWNFLEDTEVASEFWS